VSVVTIFGYKFFTLTDRLALKADLAPHAVLNWTLFPLDVPFIRCYLLNVKALKRSRTFFR